MRERKRKRKRLRKRDREREGEKKDRDIKEREGKIARERARGRQADRDRERERKRVSERDRDREIERKLFAPRVHFSVGFLNYCDLNGRSRFKARLNGCLYTGELSRIIRLCAIWISSHAILLVQKHQDKEHTIMSVAIEINRTFLHIQYLFILIYLSSYLYLSLSLSVSF